MRLATPSITYRTIAIGALGLLVTFGGWLAGSEVLSLISHFSASQDKVPPPGRIHGSAGWAYSSALVGAVRGDLWAEYGFALLEREADAASGGSPAREALQAAVRYAPYQAAVWLALAKMDATNPQLRERVPGLLKLAYYTAPSDEKLAAEWLKEAARSGFLHEQEIRSIVAAEMRRLATRAPDVRSALLAAYQLASSNGRRTLEELAGEIDPTLLSEMEKSGLPRSRQ